MSSLPLQKEKADKPKRRQTFGQKIGNRPFVPFAGDPPKDRPTKKETRDEIDAIRNSGIPDAPIENRTMDNWMNNTKVARRTKDSI